MYYLNLKDIRTGEIVKKESFFEFTVEIIEHYIEKLYRKEKHSSSIFSEYEIYKKDKKGKKYILITKGEI